MQDYSKLKKGDYISESGYGIIVFSTIISAVTKGDDGLYRFTAMSDSGGKINYTIGGAYGAIVDVVELPKYK